MIEISPCKGCTERHLACHDSCDKYKEWNARQFAQKKHLTANRNRFGPVWSPAKERTYRRENKFGRYGHQGRGGAL